jgi:hypothetical protein
MEEAEVILIGGAFSKLYGRKLSPIKRWND